MSTVSFCTVIYKGQRKKLVCFACFPFSHVKNNCDVDCDGNYREIVRTILRVFKVTVLMMIMVADNEYNVIANIRCLTVTVDFRFSLSYMQKSHLK